MATRTRTVKTSEQLKEELELARKKLAELEQRAFAGELTELIAKSNIVKDFKDIQAKVKDVQPLAIITAIAHAVGIRRLTITQAAPQKRAPSTKPRKPRAKSAAK